MDAGAIANINYSAARIVRDLQQELVARGVALVLVHAEPSLLADPRRHRLSDVIGADHIFVFAERRSLFGFAAKMCIVARNLRLSRCC